jgi:hypothetical protein
MQYTVQKQEGQRPKPKREAGLAESGVQGPGPCVLWFVRVC